MRARSAVAGLLLLVLFAVMSQAEDVKRGAVRRPAVNCYYRGRLYKTGEIVDREGFCYCVNGVVPCFKSALGFTAL